MILCRPPKAPLRPFVSLVWAQDAAPPAPPGVGRELILPAGAMHVAIRLGDSPVRLFAGADDPAGRAVGACVLAGVHEAAYRKAVAEPAASVGALLRPGAGDLLSNAPAGALAQRHTRLEDIWSRMELAELVERLEASATPAQRLAIFEAMLARRLPAVRGIDPLIAQALFRLDRGGAVGDVVTESGFSHRHLARTFAEAVGVAPKTYGRLVRFNRALERLHGAPTASLADIAMAEGYADQAHMTREFREFAGLTPGRYRRIGPVHARHVPIAA